MDLASFRIITDDLEPVVQFYERVTGASAVWPAPVFAELHMLLHDRLRAHADRAAV